MDIKSPKYNKDGTLTDEFKQFIRNKIQEDIIQQGLGYDFFSDHLWNTWFWMKLENRLLQFKNGYIFDHWKWGTDETYKDQKHLYTMGQEIKGLKMNAIVKRLKNNLPKVDAENFKKWNKENRNSLMVKCFYEIFPKLLKFDKHYLKHEYAHVNFNKIYVSFMFQYHEYIVFLKSYGSIDGSTVVDKLDDEIIDNMVKYTLSKLDPAMKNELDFMPEWKLWFNRYLTIKYKKIPVATMNLKTILNNPIFPIKEYKFIKEKWYKKLQEKARPFLIQDIIIKKYEEAHANIHWLNYLLSMIIYHAFQLAYKQLDKHNHRA